MSMGRELVSRKDAADILGVTVSHVSYLTRRGALRPVNLDGPRMKGELMYDQDEVYALAEARERGRSPQEVHQTASQAWAAARIAQRRVSELSAMLGLNLPELKTDPEEIHALHELAGEDLKEVTDFWRASGGTLKSAALTEKVNFWTDKLFRMCDEYLRQVAQCGYDPPHEPYLSLANQLAHRENVADPDPDIFLAYNRLHAARERFRHSIFTYYLSTEGKKKAFALFPSEFEGPHYDIMRLATM